MSADIINRLFITAIKNQSFESANVDESYRADFDKIVQELKDAPVGVQPMPVNEWVGDENDDLLALFEEGLARVETSKSIGNYEVNKAEGFKR